MISGIKIYNGEGKLQKEISAKKATKLYNDTNKEAWNLSSTERKRWNGMVMTEPSPYQKKGLRPWIKRSYKKQKAKYKIKCRVCDQEVLMSSKNAKTCSKKCVNKHHHEQQRLRKLVGKEQLAHD